MTDPLDPESLAKYLGVRLISPTDIPGMSPKALNTLLEGDSDNWSAVTVSLGTTDLIIFNPRHSRRRRSNDLMHEMAHLLLSHEPSQMFFGAGTAVALRSFNDRQEQEAVWFAGALLLPREVLLAIASDGIDHASACDQFGVSRELLTYRLNVSGVNTQMRRRQGIVRNR